MTELADDFEAHRSRLRGVAFRMLGSMSESDDAVQETWLRLARTDLAGVRNLGGWLTTVVSRICLDRLRARAARREELIGRHEPDNHVDMDRSGEPEHEALLIGEVGRALLVVLDRLAPVERIAFVLHDMFGVPFEEIAPVVARSAATTKKLASRARLRVRGATAVPGAELAQHRRLAEAFLAASRAGDIEAIVAVLDPYVVRQADRTAVPAGRPSRVQGARTVAEEIAVFGGRAIFAAAALVSGDVGIIVAPHGRLQLVLTLSIANDKIVGYELIAEPSRLAQFEIAVLDSAADARRRHTPDVRRPST